MDFNFVKLARFLLIELLLVKMRRYLNVLLFKCQKSRPQQSRVQIETRQ